ncbi:MAG: hypothetical protein WC393_04325 [Candidatus Nanoarchaeia archaeon]|jgi:hypothetical protein
MTLPGFVQKSSGLEGLMVKTSILTPYEVLEKTKNDLGLTKEDLLFLSANYLQDSIKFYFNKNHKEFNVPLSDMGKYLMDISQYKPVNYNEEKFESYTKLNLNYVEKAKLEFELILYAITSESLLRNYFKKTEPHKVATVFDKMNHAELAVSLMEKFDSLKRKEKDKSFLGKFGEIETNGVKTIGWAQYGTELNELTKKGVSKEFIIDHILKNAYKNYFLSSPNNC